MGIETVSQNIGRIINWRTPGTNQWVVNGTPFAGTVVTVGAGKDYADLWSAIDDTAGDTMFLVYPGTYGEIMTKGTLGADDDRTLYVKGMGTSYSDVVIKQFTIYNQNLFVEWCTIHYTGGTWWMGCIEPTSGTSGHSLIFNKCAILADRGSYPVFCPSPPSVLPSLFWFSHCLVDGPSWDIYCQNSGGLNISTMYMDHIWHRSVYDWQFSYTTGSLAQDVTQHSESPVSDYGPESGDFLINYESTSPGGGSPGSPLWVSQPISLTRLRRNANNVPGEVVAGDIAWVSQPCGDIIRLRRNTSNVPEE